MAIVNLYSNDESQISKFLSDYYNMDDYKQNDLKWEKSFENPVQIADIIGLYIDNKDKYNVSLWISIDPECFINVTENNANEIIKYLYERFPY